MELPKLLSHKETRPHPSERGRKATLKFREAKQRVKQKEVSAMGGTNQQDGLWKIGFGELGATLKALQDNGVTVEQMARLRAEPDYARRVAEFMAQGGLEASVHQRIARAILGQNFFGVKEWFVLYGVSFSKKHLRQATEFPWSEDVLNAPCPFHEGKSIKETHFAFLGVDAFKGEPLTIHKWQELYPATGQPRFCSYPPKSWYSQQKFAGEPTCDFRWYLMPLEFLPGSTDKLFQRQTEMLSADYEVPLAVEEVTKIILYYRKNGFYLNPTKYGRCQDVTSSGGRVRVGNSAAGGLDVDDDWGDRPGHGIGLAVSRKP